MLFDEKASSGFAVIEAEWGTGRSAGRREWNQVNE